MMKGRSMFVAALDVRDRGHTGSLVLPVESISRIDRSNVVSHEPRNDGQRRQMHSRRAGG